MYESGLILFRLLQDFRLCQIRVTDEALIAETMVWPKFFLMNAFFALKGSKLLLLFYSLIFLDFKLKVLIFPCIFYLTGLYVVYMYKAEDADLSGTEKFGQYEA